MSTKLAKDQLKAEISQMRNKLMQSMADERLKQIRTQLDELQEEFPGTPAAVSARKMSEVSERQPTPGDTDA